jgi:hypothetical protein
MVSTDASSVQQKMTRHSCRRHDECKLGDQTKDDADKEPREERSCGHASIIG